MIVFHSKKFQGTKEKEQTELSSKKNEKKETDSSLKLKGQQSQASASSVISEDKKTQGKEKIKRGKK